MHDTNLVNLPEQRGRELCRGQLEIHRRLLNVSVTYQERRAQIDNRALAASTPDTRYRAERALSPFPVVVHVVHNPADPAQNVSVAQIESQMDVLNEDFRANNPQRDQGAGECGLTG